MCFVSRDDPKMSANLDRVWHFPSSDTDASVHALSEAFQLPTSLSRLLIKAGFGSVATAEKFLQPRLQDLSDPFLLPGVQEAVDRILKAIDREERIVLFGDYDVDGVTSIAMLARILRSYGAEPAQFLPHRIDEGYGLSAEGVSRCLQLFQPELFIALDCGTASIEQIANIKSQGTDVIVIDHHEPKSKLPECQALINPKTGSNFHYFCTVGLVFKLCHGLLKQRRLTEVDLKDFLDLIAVGTVADLAPLIGENRTLVYHGLKRVASSRWIGLRALVRRTGIVGPLKATEIAFRIGPRLNAAGRIGAAQEALDLLLTEDASEADRLAESLDRQNRERQAVEQATIDQAFALLADRFDPLSAAVVVGSRGWHPGVVGIVASRLVRHFHRPTIVIGFDEDGIGKGSGRSIPGFSLVRALEACDGVLTQFGGHEMAAGVTLPFDRLASFTEMFLATARENLPRDLLTPKYIIDAVVSGRQLNFEFLTGYERLQPFGIGNPAPLFCLRGAEPGGEPRLVKEKHRVFSIRHEGRLLRAIHFGAGNIPVPPAPWDIAFFLETNWFQERLELQLQIEAIRSYRAD
jgi:single-stranded-DNA-specific exonuclease